MNHLNKTSSSSKRKFKLPSLLDATLILAILSVAGYVITYFRLFTTYKHFNIPREFIEVTFNKVIDTASIYYWTGFATVFIAYVIQRLWSKLGSSSGLKTIMNHATLHIFCWLILLIGFYGYLDIKLSIVGIIAIVCSALIIVLDVNKKRLSEPFEKLQEYLGNWYLVIFILLLLPFISFSLMSYSLFFNVKHIEIIEKNTTIEKKIENKTESIKIVQKETSDQTVEELQKELKDNGLIVDRKEMKIVVGEYENKFIVRIAEIKDYYNGMPVLSHFKPEFELIPKDSEYDLRITKFDKPLAPL
ncbi:hypothetical protein [Brevibacillus centrosporus]|jgi:ABC-type multidrug transport system fused ATPase/permease subunit|uniref:hypothetical protein n=1 Tax=Brevibacillus TaxID=55080 RepID=UPI003985FF57